MTPQPVEMLARDGCALRGQIWPGGSEWSVLLHDVGPEEDLDRWRPLIPGLLAEGLTVLAVDLRGHGVSEGVWGDDTAVGDTVAALRFARESGARFVAAIAAGLSGIPVLRAVEQEAVEGVVVLSAMPPRRRHSSPATSSTRRSDSAEGGEGERLPRGAGIPKLFIVGAHDLLAREASERLRRASIGWALEVTFPTDQHGTGLLHGAWLGHAGEQIRGFVREQRFLARSSVGLKGDRG